MTCVDFERRLEGWLGGGLTAAERAACARHLAGCARCHDLADLTDLADLAGPDGPAAPAATDPSSEPPPELLSRILEGVLERTTGSACGSARELLVPLVDGDLPAAERELLELHLESCSGCRELRAVLVRMAEDLPRLAEADPGPGFVEGVLVRTAWADRARGASRRTPPLRRWWRRVGSGAWASLVRRPRFAWEAAYVLVLLLMPLIAWAELPGAAAEAVGRIGRAGGETVASTVQGVTVRAARGADSLGAAAGAELRTFGTRLASSLQKAGQKTGQKTGQTAAEDGPAEPNDSKEDTP
jgi:anti-sigma factor RsiW